MNQYNRVLLAIESASISLSAEKVELLESVNRVLQENIVADVDMPPFNKSAMDGYACRKADLENELEVKVHPVLGRVSRK